MQQQRSGSLLPLDMPPNGTDAKKRVKLEHTGTNSGSQARAQASGSKQASSSKQAMGTKHTASSKLASASRLQSASRHSSEDAKTNTDSAGQQSSQQLPNADTLTSAPAPQQLVGMAGNPVMQRAPKVPQEQQVSFPFRLVKPRAAQAAPGQISAAVHASIAASQQAQASDAPQAVSQDQDSRPTASIGGDNCMAVLAEAAAAASEGSAASSSSHAHSDDDQDAAAILRDLQNSAGPPQRIGSQEGQLMFVGSISAIVRDLQMGWFSTRSVDIC